MRAPDSASAPSAVAQVAFARRLHPCDSAEARWAPMIFGRPTQQSDRNLTAAHDASLVVVVGRPIFNPLAPPPAQLIGWPLPLPLPPIGRTRCIIDGQRAERSAPSSARPGSAHLCAKGRIAARACAPLRATGPAKFISAHSCAGQWSCCARQLPVSRLSRPKALVASQRGALSRARARLVPNGRRPSAH